MRFSLLLASAWTAVLVHAKEIKDKDEFPGQSQEPPRNLQDFVSLPLLADSFGDEPGFYHGVASGDPIEDGVILWTRYTPSSETDIIPVEFRIAEVDPRIPLEAHLDPSANPSIMRGTALTDATIDWVVKLDLRGLKSYTDYVFAFVAEGKTSVVGQTRTAPSLNDTVEKLRYVLLSCADYERGYFHSYDLASTIEAIDVWFMIGDYIYVSFGKSKCSCFSKLY